MIPETPALLADSLWSYAALLGTKAPYRARSYSSKGQSRENTLVQVTWCVIRNYFYQWRCQTRIIFFYVESSVEVYGKPGRCRELYIKVQATFERPVQQQRA